MLFLALFSTPSLDLETNYINKAITCNQEIPPTMRKYSDLYLEHFDFNNMNEIFVDIITKLTSSMQTTITVNEIKTLLLALHLLIEMNKNQFFLIFSDS